MTTKGKRIFTGTAGVYYVMYRLAREGYHASCTHGNAPNVDILVSSCDGEHLVAIQVKTTEYATRERGRGDDRKPAKLDFPLGKKCGKLNNQNTFFGFVDLGTEVGKEPDVYVIPSSFIHEFCRPWIDRVPMVRFQPTIDQVRDFKNAWHRLNPFVGEPSLEMEAPVVPDGEV